MWRRVLIALAVLALVLAGAGLTKRDDIARLMAVNTLFDEDRIVANFSGMDALFHAAPMPLPMSEPSPLPRGAPAALPDGAAEWIAERHVTALVVLKDGAVAFEEYYLGTGPDDLRISWSVAKSFLAALFGLSVADGSIASLDDPVTKYAPALAGSAYDGASIRNVLNMASGVAFDEDYLDFWSDINKMGRVVALGGSLDDFAAGIDASAGPPGSAFRYVSIDTHVLAMVLRGATGRTLPDLMAERLFAPLGLERSPYYLTDGEGVAFALGGLNLTTRDYARFGQMILQGGAWQGEQILPAAWVTEMTRQSAPPAADGMTLGYGYQWWLPEDARPGEVFAIGVYGQWIWIDRAAGVVIARNAADRDFLEPGVLEENIAMFRAITEAVQ